MMSLAQRASLARFLQRTRRTMWRTASPREVRESAAGYPVGRFGPQHGLTTEEAWLAQRLLNRADQRRPLRGNGRSLHFRRALWIAGLVSAVKRGVVGNSR